MTNYLSQGRPTYRNSDAATLCVGQNWNHISPVTTEISFKPDTNASCKDSTEYA